MKYDPNDPILRPKLKRSCRFARRYLREALAKFHQAKRYAPPLGPDHEVAELIRTAEESMRGIMANWKAWEKSKI
jgi:hypothetical protein